MKKIAEGWHGIIYLTEYNTIIKKFKNKLHKNYEKEKRFLLELQNFKFVPRILSFNDNDLEIEMEYIEGITFEDCIEQCSTTQITKIICRLLDILYTLDSMGIDKTEMNRPYKHIIIRNNRIVLIDWERAKKSKKPKNITQFVSFIINSKELSKKLNITEENKSKIISLLKTYKRTYDKKIIETICSILGYSFD